LINKTVRKTTTENLKNVLVNRLLIKTCFKN
jgi:hypothetical protein